MIFSKMIGSEMDKKLSLSVKIKGAFVYFINLPRLFFWKVRFGSKISAHILQAFGRSFRMSIKGKSKVSFGKSCSSVNNTQITVSDAILEVGSNCFFNVNCSITVLKSVKIGDNCTFGNNLVIVDHDHDFSSQVRGGFVSEDVILGNNVWVGANVVILKGTKIGKDSVIAAGSIVKGEIPENTLFYQKRESVQREISIKEKPDEEK